MMPTSIFTVVDRGQSPPLWGRAGAIWREKA